MRKLVRKLKKPLQLSDWKIETNFAFLDHKADAEALPPYREALLQFDLGKIPEGDEIAYVIHEMLHCHVNGLSLVAEALAKTDTEKKWVEDAEEYLTTTLEKIITPLIFDLYFDNDK